jgi:hypothetical protein
MKPICFVVGAGASAAYDFPLGHELVTEILELHPDNPPWKEMGNGDRLGQFQGALRYSDHSSIDILLEHRVDLWEIGAQAIAAVLLPKESPMNLARFARRQNTTLYDYNRSHDRWYGLLFEKLARLANSFADFTRLPISFVTFNYDRSFDFFFWQWLHVKYSVTPQALSDYLSKLQIFHVHGQLGKLAFQDGAPAEKLEYGRPMTHIEVERAAKTIHIPHNADLVNQPGYKSAVERIKEAKTLVFLGFGFDERNFERLQVPDVRDQNQLMIYATSYNLNPVELARVNGLMGLRVHDLGSPKFATREYLESIWPALRERILP